MKRRRALQMAVTTALGLALAGARVAAQTSSNPPSEHGPNAADRPSNAAGQEAGAPTAPGTSPVMNALCAYMSAAASRPLPPEAIEQAKYHILDTVAAMISGSELPPGQAALRYARMYGAKGEGTIVASDLRTGPLDAALINGVLAQADETDDSHSPSRSHPGCSVIPAALASGEQFGIGGAHFVRAVTLGYDIGPRVTMALGGAAFSYESHKSTHAIAGIFGSAAAAACAAGLDAQQMHWLLDYTAQQSSGIAAWGRDTDHIEKAFVFGGMPARDGVTSALLVRAGWNGIEDVFSGADNYFLAYAPAGDPGQLVDKLGERYEIMRTDIKKWTVGSPIQGPLDAIQSIRGRRPFEADQVERVVVRLAPAVAKVVDNRDIPDICLQHLVAIMLLDKTVSFKATHDKARMQDAAVLGQRAKVQLVRDAELEKFLPVRVAVVEMTFADGTQLSERVTAVRGTPRNPMTRAEIVDKSRDLIAPVLGPDKSGRLIETLLSLETVTDVRGLRPLLVR
jgi:2-methylcitrate dehydratase PrpD